MSKTGVLVVRFQLPELHSGHKKILDQVFDLSDNVVIVVGESPAIFTDKHPLSYNIRETMLKSLFNKNVHVVKLNDCRDNETWSGNLDDLLKEYDGVTLYCSRDGFKNLYYGIHKVVELEEIPNISASQIRNNIVSINSPDFRSGIIYATQRRYPIVYPTVDIAVLKYTDVDNKIKILLGRKPTETQWRLPGGFVDKSDASLEAAADRELHEEAGRFITHEFKYLGSFQVSDWRYKGTKDAVMTSLFMTHIMGGEPKAGDDLAEVSWYSLEEARNIIVPEHLSLLEKVIAKIS